MNEYKKSLDVVVAESAQDIAGMVAAEIAKIILTRKTASLPTVLGLAAGSTPILLYNELIRLHCEEGLDFSQVVTFNLDEYYPMDSHSVHSYHYFMKENLFKHINIKPINTNILNGDVPREVVASHCAEYEEKIRQIGGINFLVLGIGQNGHIAFNEPGSEIVTRTRLVTLDQITRHNAANEFGGETHVPREAITMGVATILNAHKIALIVSGDKKAHIIQQVIEDPISASIPATYLRSHNNTTMYFDSSTAVYIDRTVAKRR